MPSPEAAYYLFPFDLSAEIAFYDGRSLELSSWRAGYKSPRHYSSKSAAFPAIGWLPKLLSNMARLLKRVDGDSNAVTVQFQDGAFATGDILVGADGYFSKVRRNSLSKLGKA
jgi:hypothetical protein